MRVESFSDPSRSEVGFLTRVDRIEAVELGRRIYARAVEIAAEAIAAQIVKDFGQEIIAKCDMQAVANLSVAEAAVSVRETIHRDLKKIDRTLDRGLSELNEPVYESTWFGLSERRVR